MKSFCTLFFGTALVLLSSPAASAISIQDILAPGLPNLNRKLLEKEKAEKKAEAAKRAKAEKEAAQKRINEINEINEIKKLANAQTDAAEKMAVETSNRIVDLETREKKLQGEKSNLEVREKILGGR